MKQKEKMENLGAETITKKEIFNGVELETIYRRSREPVDPADDYDMSKLEGLDATGHGFCAKFNQRTYEEGGIICEQDIPVKLRDGTTIYTDIYRPKDKENIPCLVSWSMYGKRPGDGMSEWQIMGVPPGTVSNMAKFESPDPAYWCHNGYAVANVDPRGGATARATSICSVVRILRMAMTLSSGWPPSGGAAAKLAWAATAVWP